MGNDLITVMANAVSLDRKQYWHTLKATVIPGKVSDEDVVAFLAVAREYGLNPLTREVYAFPAKGGGISPIVSIDGWLKLGNDHPQFDGMELDEKFSGDGTVISVTCRVYRKDRSHPMVATEYFQECFRNTEPWNNMPVRMLTTRAIVQALRRAFSFSGIYEPDEARDFAEADYDDLTNIGAAQKTSDRADEIRQKLDKATNGTPADDGDGAPEVGDPGTTDDDDEPETAATAGDASPTPERSSGQPRSGDNVAAVEHMNYDQLAAHLIQASSDRPDMTAELDELLPRRTHRGYTNAQKLDDLRSLAGRYQ